MTGCVEVGLGGLHGLIHGVGETLVKEAKTFFGFIPRRSMLDRRVRPLLRLDRTSDYQTHWQRLGIEFDSLLLVGV